MHPQSTRNNELIRKAQTGDLTARNQLIEENIGLMKSIIGSCAIPRTQTGEHLFAATEAFVRCIRAFDPDKGISLTTYATRSIRQEVYRTHNRHAGTISVPDRRKGKTNLNAQADLARSTKRVHPDLPVPTQNAIERPYVDLQAKLWDWVADLPPVNREVFWLASRGVSSREIGKRLGFSKSQALVTLNDSIHALKIRADREAA